MIGTHNLSCSHFPLVKTIYYLMAERLTILTLPSTSVLKKLQAIKIMERKRRKERPLQLQQMILWQAYLTVITKGIHSVMQSHLTTMTFLKVSR